MKEFTRFTLRVFNKQAKIIHSKRYLREVFGNKLPMLNNFLNNEI